MAELVAKFVAMGFEEALVRQAPAPHCTHYMSVVPIMVREDGDERDRRAATLTHVTIHQLADE